MDLPVYKGAVFRGAFGSVFKRVVCPSPKAACQTCILRANCLYVAVFESPPPPHYPDAGKFRQAPRPYVLNPPLLTQREFSSGDDLLFELVLIGRAITALPYFIVVFDELGRMGLGRNRGKFVLSHVDLLRSNECQTIYDRRTRSLRSFTPEKGPRLLPGDEKVSRLAMQFLTPVRLKEKGALVTQLNFPIFFERLVQRLTLLASFYETAPDLPDWPPLVSLAHQIQIMESHLSWYDWERYSRRQEATMKFGGLRGRLVLSGPLGPLLPYLRLGSQVNVGQETTFGLGRYDLVIEKDE